MKQMLLGIAGCGGIAGWVARSSRSLPRLTLAACCDANHERAKSFASEYQIPAVYSDYAEFLAASPLDAVYLATPHHLHYSMILAAVQAGKAVLAEKPLTRTLAEGNELVEILEPRGAKVGVNYQNRYDTGCYALARAVQAGALGRVHSVRINVPWHREQKYFENSPWHKTLAQAGGGTLITQGSHYLDVALWALGDHPVSAMGYIAQPGFTGIEVDTLVHATVETAGGALVSITTTMAAAVEQAVTIEMYGERGTALFRNSPRPLVRFVGVEVQPERPMLRGSHPVQRSLAGFVRWILDDRPFLIPARSALPVLAAVDGIYRSAASGRRVAIA